MSRTRQQWPSVPDGGRYPWLHTVREMEADRERGVPPKVPPGTLLVVTWADLLDEPTRTERPDVVITKRYRRRLVAEGRCVVCRELVEVCGNWKCDKCAQSNASTHRERRARYSAEGACQQCGKRPPEAARAQCRPCLDKLAAWA